MKIRNTMISVSVLLLSMALTSCGKNEEKESVEERIIAVKAAVVHTSDEEVIKTYTGTLEGVRQAVLRSKISESVEKIHVKEGDRVQANSVLVTLDKSGSSSSYQQTYSVYKNAEKNYNKMKYLYDEGAVSESMYDDARTNYEVSKAAFEAARKLVEIQTPISGIVTSVEVSRGEYLSPGQVVATVATTDSLRVKFGVNSADISHVTVGDPVRIVVEDVNRVATGEIISVASSADPGTRAFQVEAVLDNRDNTFSPGLFVRIELIMKKLPDVITIPHQAVITLEGKDEVYVVKGSIAQKRDITLGDDLDGRIVVLDGLQAGDTLVTLGQNYLEDGVRVNITTFETGK